MAKVKCPKCFTVNPEGRDSCIKCASPLPRIRIEAQPTPPPPPGPAPDAAIQFRRGQVVAGRYTVLNLIGRGGMGCIYKVLDNTLGEEVALKTLLPQLVRDRAVVERFFNEARIARRLAHPNIVRVHDIGSAGRVIYISMEYVKGKSLRGFIEESRPGGGLPLTRVLLLMDELCAALAYAHQFTVHRDIKPENVMLSEDGHVKLMDFGISKLMADTRLTNASVVMGTPFYMAPEQLRNSRDVDARADIYSMGVMLYEILSGSVPTGVPKPLSELLEGLPPALDLIVARCVDPDPAKRYQSANELRDALRPTIEFIEGGGKFPAKSMRTTVQVDRSSVRKAVGAVLALAILAGTGFGLYNAEARRRETLANTSPAAPAANAARAVSRWSEIESLINRARGPALARAELSPSFQAVCDEGQHYWQSAVESRDASPEEALRLANWTLQCYLAPLLWQEGLVVVSPGMTQIQGQEVPVDGFLIEENEVTVGQFRRFCMAVDQGWPMPPGLEDYPEDLPAVWLAWYDAQAYAAWRGRLLPTEAQWARAAFGAEPVNYPWGNDWQPGAAQSRGMGEYPARVRSYPSDKTWAGAFDMAGNVSEWTRSPADPRLNRLPYFGDGIVVRGGNFRSGAEVTLNASFSEVFEGRRGDMGFRCVVEIPTERDAVETILAGT